MKKNNGNSIEESAEYLNVYQEFTALDYIKFRIENTRRKLMELDAAVELGTEYGHALSEILVRAITEIEELAERVNEEN